MICSRCNGKGHFVTTDKSFTTGYTILKCGCQFSVEEMGITPLFLDASFENYTVNKTVAWFQDYMKTFKVVDTTHGRAQLKQLGIYVWGGVGCGKSYLSCATIVDLAKTKGVRGYFVDVTELCDIGRKADLGDSDAWAKFEVIKNKELLVVDDIGTEKLSTWVENFLFTLVHHRYVQWLPTIYTTNINATDMPRRFSEVQVGDRFVSRFNACCHILGLTSADYRLTISDAKSVIK